jgi:hypothetical protein
VLLTALVGPLIIFSDLNPSLTPNAVTAINVEVCEYTKSLIRPFFHVCLAHGGFVAPTRCTREDVALSTPPPHFVVPQLSL